MTGAELTEHRLKSLEEIAVGARETERRVDTLTLSLATIEREVHEIAKSVDAFHRRLDDVIRDETREQGRDLGLAEGRSEGHAEGVKEGVQAGRQLAQRTTWKVVGWTAMAMIAFGALVVGILTLVLG